MMIDYVIMAQGKATRWEDKIHPEINIDCPKQGLVIGNKTILQRTIDMFKPHGNIHVVCDNCLEPYFDRTSVNRVLTLNGDPGTLLRGIHIILVHKFISSEHVVFLLGDVIFSHKMKDLIVSNQDDFPTLFGRTGRNEITGKFAPELFALSVCDTWFSMISSATHDIWQEKTAIKQDAKLWDLENRFNLPVLALNYDYTDDIDNIQEYEKFYFKLREKAEKDDTRISAQT